MKRIRRLKLLGMTLCAMMMAVVTGCGSTPITQSTNQTQHSSNTSKQKPSSSANTTNSTNTGPSTSSAKSGHSPDNGKTTEKKPAPPKPILVKLGDQTSYASYLNESLALLGYLPVRFVPAHGLTIQQAMSKLAVAKTPIPGAYKWTNTPTASALSPLWNPQSDTVITEGALMTFQLNHSLGVDGVAGNSVWKALQADLAKGVVYEKPYVFVTVDEHPTEILRIWQNGKVIFQTPANTGISQSPTSIGTWPVYLRYVSQEMKGTDPWGNKYDDPGVPYVSYFHGGEAIHGFVRGQYGYPQSLGCVEIPVDTARTVFNLINYGTLVSVRS